MVKDENTRERINLHEFNHNSLFESIKSPVLIPSNYSREPGEWPIILNGSQLPWLIGLSYGNIRVMYFNGSKWAEVPYQIDDRGYYYTIIDFDDDTGQAVWGWVFGYIKWGGEERGEGGAITEEQISKCFDRDDEIVFYVYDGWKVDDTFWWNKSYPYRIEIEIHDPVDRGIAWMYIYFRNDTVIITENPYEDTIHDYVDWMYENLTAKSDHYVLGLNTSNPDLVSFSATSNSTQSIISEGNKNWARIYASYSLFSIELNYAREGTWDQYYSDIKTNIGYLNENSIKQEGVGDGKAVIDGPVRVIINSSGYISVTINIGSLTEKFYEVVRNIIAFYRSFTTSSFQLRIDAPSDPNIEVRLEYAFLLTNTFSDYARSQELIIYFGNHTTGEIYGVNVVDGNTSNDFYTSGGNPWEPDLTPIRENNEIPDWVIINLSETLEFIGVPKRVFDAIKDKCDGIYIYWRDDNISELGFVIEGAEPPLKTPAALVLRGIIPIENLDATVVRDIGEKWYKYVNSVNVSIRDTETNVADAAFFDTSITMMKRREDVIIEVHRIPDVVNYDQNPIIYANITALKNISTICLMYRYNDEWIPSLMRRINSSKIDNVTIMWYNASIPQFKYGICIYYYVYVITDDNETYSSKIYSYCVADLHPPEIRDVSIQTYKAGNNVTLTIIANVYEPENASGVKDVFLYYKYEDEDTYRIIKMSFNGTTWLANITLLEWNKEIYYYIKAVDRANNELQTEVHEFVIMDTQPPHLDILTPENNTITNKSIILNLEVSDEESGVRNVEIYANETLIVNITAEKSMSIEIELAEGLYILRIKANDMVGNSVEKKLIVIFDKSPPIISVLSPKNNTKYLIEQQVEVKISCRDEMTAVTQINAFLDGRKIASSDNLTKVKAYLSQGRHVICIQAKDLAGNIRECVIIVEVLLSIPVISLMIILACISPILFLITKRQRSR